MHISLVKDQVKHKRPLVKEIEKNLQNTQIDKNTYSEDDWLDFDESSYSEVDEDSETYAEDFDNTRTKTSNLSEADSSFKAPGPDDP